MKFGTKPSNQDLVKEFMQVMGQRIQPDPVVDPDVKQLRYDLLKEELREFKKAVDENDIVETADALADLLYVTYGAALAFGINIDAVFAEVHRSNMAKAPGGVVTRRTDGKVLKPEGWTPPDIQGALEGSTVLEVVYCCEECGGAKIQYTAWVDANTGELVPGDGPFDYLYCPDCDERDGNGEVTGYYTEEQEVC